MLKGMPLVTEDIVHAMLHKVLGNSDCHRPHVPSSDAHLKSHNFALKDSSVFGALKLLFNTELIL